MDAVWAFTLGISQESHTYKALAEFISEIDRRNIIDKKILLTKLP